MKRLVPVFFLFLLVGVACGKESSIVPIVSEGPTFTPSATAQVTIEPFVTPTPTEAPLETPTPTPEPTSAATTGPTTEPATPTPSAHVFATHPNTATDQPPDAYLHSTTQELKGLATEFNWQTSASKRTYYQDNTPDPSDTIGVTRGANLSIAYTRSDQPSHVFASYRIGPDASASSTPIAVSQTNPAEIQATFPTGTVWVDIHTYWSQGDVVHTFKLNVS